MPGHPIYEITESGGRHDWKLYEQKALDSLRYHYGENERDPKDYLFAIIPSGEWRPRHVEMRAFYIHRQTACFFFIHDEKGKERRVRKLGSRSKYSRSAEGAYRIFIEYRQCEYMYLMMRLHRCAMQARIMNPKQANKLEEALTRDHYSGEDLFLGEKDLWNADD
jgi:hypothetical protein